MRRPHSKRARLPHPCARRAWQTRSATRSSTRASTVSILTARAHQPVALGLLHWLPAFATGFSSAPAPPRPRHRPCPRHRPRPRLYPRLPPATCLARSILLTGTSRSGRSRPTFGTRPPREPWSGVTQAGMLRRRTRRTRPHWQCPKHGSCAFAPAPSGDARGSSGRLDAPRGESQATRHPAPASGARASRLQSRRFRGLFLCLFLCRWASRWPRSTPRSPVASSARASGSSGSDPSGRPRWCSALRPNPKPNPKPSRKTPTLTLAPNLAPNPTRYSVPWLTQRRCRRRRS